MSKFKTPTQALGAPKYPMKHEDHSWFFSSDHNAWHPGAKLSSERYKEKGLRGVKTGNKAFEKMNDAITYYKDI